MEDLYRVGSLFSERLFSIPEYQRGYAWGKKHCQDFVEDLELPAKRREHFLGLLILHQRDGESPTVIGQRGCADL